MSVLHLQYEQELYNKLGQLDMLIDEASDQQFLEYVNERMQDGGDYSTILGELQKQLNTTFNLGKDVGPLQSKMVIVNSLIERSYIITELERIKKQPLDNSSGTVI